VGSQTLNNQWTFSPDDAQTIYIIGPKKLQNETLAFCLEQKISTRCQIIGDLAAIPLPDGAIGNNPRRLVMLDCQGKDPEGLLLQLQSLWQDKFRDIVAFYNASGNLDLEENCLLEGIRGLFYEQDPLNLLARGVQAILSGELWLSREIMTRWLLQESRQQGRGKRKASNLTKREAEILAQVAVGDSNQEIADKLNISPHTVRTHIYNIFKKIKVSNRLQATFWAARNL
jgi:LuxR family transcriptional regulator of csgAB operon